MWNFSEKHELVSYYGMKNNIGIIGLGVIVYDGTTCRSDADSTPTDTTTPADESGNTQSDPGNTDSTSNDSNTGSTNEDIEETEPAESTSETTVPEDAGNTGETGGVTTPEEDDSEFEDFPADT